MAQYLIIDPQTRDIAGIDPEDYGSGAHFIGDSAVEAYQVLTDDYGIGLEDIFNLANAGKVYEQN